MTSKNKFGFEPIETKSSSSPRRRSPGPMGMAVREAAESLQESTETKVEQRRQNSEDAKDYRAAQAEGRVLATLPIESVLTDGLPRDRLELEAVAASDEMDELITSIRSRGQREPIEVYCDEVGNYQLKKGWRRLTALRRLFAETADASYANVIARVAVEDVDRLALYVDMVEENIIREDLTFAEMAQLAITAASDQSLDEHDAEVMVGRLFGSLHKMKRSYIRSFVYLLLELGDDLKWPKDVSRNLGVDVARKLKSTSNKDVLRSHLFGCKSREEQAVALKSFLDEDTRAAGKASSPPREKFEFHVGSTKVTARSGECRIVDKRDYTQLPKGRLEQAILAFQRALDK